LYSGEVDREERRFDNLLVIFTVIHLWVMTWDSRSNAVAVACPNHGAHRQSAADSASFPGNIFQMAGT
jgi:hypothetical protein